MLISWMVSHPIPVKIINALLRVLVPLMERVPILSGFLLLLLALVLKVVNSWRLLRRWFFQGKPWNHDNREHLIIELGDVMWYVMQACAALNVTLDEVIEGNVEKLKKRYTWWRL